MRADSFLTAAGGGPRSDVADAALADSAPTVLWLDQPARPVAAPALDGPTTADLVVVGGGFTGLWTALCAVEADP
ncbi:MAG TPA: FAD-dependent oxidoreductase, partial [Acidimicrobiaceae bacterium]|nr:FAD-dependent oxidoreductase [Acidimicrobiaceae bacterium]